MAQIICPYCCHRFPPNVMWFTLDSPMDTPEEQKETESEEDIFSSSGSNLKGKDKTVRDEELIWYFRTIERLTEKEAVAKAKEVNPYGCIEIDFTKMGSDISHYNEKILERYGFVMELEYKNHHLQQRVCPKCHNHIVKTAGLYEMKLIAMYGDTSSGKTVYLNILQAMLQGNAALGNVGYSFRGQMDLVGSQKKKEEHDENLEKLLNAGLLPEATPGGKIVPPEVYEYSYYTAEDPQNLKNVLLVFRDIPGEDCLNPDNLESYKFYLKNSDGIIVLLDSSWLSVSVRYLNPDKSANNRMIDSLTNLKQLLTSVFGENEIDIPAAIVLAKGDLLKSVPSIINRYGDEFSEIMDVENANELHKTFLDRSVIDDLNRKLKTILSGVGEERLLDRIDRCFKNYSYFCISSLGKAPEKDKGIDKAINITPYRVGEPLYWLMAKLDLIPYRYMAKYRYRRRGFLGKEVESRPIITYYFESERGGVAQKRHREQAESNGIDMNRAHRISQTNSF